MHLKNIQVLSKQSSSSRGFLARLCILSFVLPVFWPVIGSFGFDTKYTYANEYRTIQLGERFQLQNPSTSFTIELQTSHSVNESIRFVVQSKNESTEAPLEIEWDEVDGRYLTAPVHFNPTKEIQVTCIGCETISDASVHLIALDTRSTKTTLSFDASHLAQTAFAKSIGGIPVISRAQWWADETLRFTDHPIWKKRAEQAATPPSEAVRKAQEKQTQIEEHLRSQFPEEFETNEVIRTENGKQLVWPIQKSKYVRKIVLHHTAENNVKSLSDEELMRSMYYYHTISRGWGDIGYHYVVGQRGQIYEGRAGWDYAVGAHVSWNNRGSVWVSVIGNFETDVLVREQETVLPKLLTAIAKQYGINTSSEVFGHKACKSDEACATIDFTRSALMGHRDVWYTSCPGANLYANLTEKLEPKLAAATQNLKPIPNPIYRPETLREERSSDEKGDTNDSSKPLSSGPNIRILLSTPDFSDLELEAIQGTPILHFAPIRGKEVRGWITSSRIQVKKKGVNLELTLNGKKYTGKTLSLSADLVRVNNWARIPAWDKEKRYNDNVFRGTLEIRRENGKLIVINELPLEYYLRWLAEVSNGELPAKTKTIIVAARSYALYYTDPKNRKFPGKPYDGSDDPDVFQKYLGYGYEKRSPSTVRAVLETNGEVITYKGTLIKPWYFNQSDGKTLSAKEYCERRKAAGAISKNALCEDIPYLQSVEDPGSNGLTRNGHGVWISGAGATFFAREYEWDYKKIISYFIQGGEIGKRY